METLSVRHRLPRYQIQLPVLQKADPSATRVEVGWTRHLSESGACLVLANPPQ